MPALPITDLTTAHLSVSTSRLGFQKPLGTATKALPSLDYVTVRLKAGDLEGLGYAFTPGHGALAIRACIEELKSAVVGADALAPRDLWETTARRLSFVGPEGVGAFAMAAVDIACWDLAAQAHKVPLYRLLGHEGRPLPVYGTVGLLSLSLDELRQQTSKVLELRGEATRRGLRQSYVMPAGSTQPSSHDGMRRRSTRTAGRRLASGPF